MEYKNHANIHDLLNKVFKTVEIKNTDMGDIVIFTTINDEIYVMMHEQEGCEDVRLESVDNNINILTGHQTLVAEERSGSEWTSYLIGNEEGCCNFRWRGSSNGYYSESVGIYKVFNKEIMDLIYKD